MRSHGSSLFPASKDEKSLYVANVSSAMITGSHATSKCHLSIYFNKRVIEYTLDPFFDKVIILVTLATISLPSYHPHSFEFPALFNPMLQALKIISYF